MLVNPPATVSLFHMAPVEKRIVHPRLFIRYHVRSLANLAQFARAVVRCPISFGPQTGFGPFCHNMF